jgi:hypothetical protein
VPAVDCIATRLAAQDVKFGSDNISLGGGTLEKTDGIQNKLAKGIGADRELIWRGIYEMHETPFSTEKS